MNLAEHDKIVNDDLKESLEMNCKIQNIMN